MAVFTVVNIVDGDTFDVHPQWTWQDQVGSRIRPTGYCAPPLHTLTGPMAKDKLSRIILGKQVNLENPYRIDRGCLVCDVYFNGQHLADYFPEYQ